MPFLTFFLCFFLFVQIKCFIALIQGPIFLRCLRMNKAQTRDPVIERTCRQSDIVYENLGLPKEITIWVDPGEVSCR